MNIRSAGTLAHCALAWTLLLGSLGVAASGVLAQTTAASSIATTPITDTI